MKIIVKTEKRKKSSLPTIKPIKWRFKIGGRGYLACKWELTEDVLIETLVGWLAIFKGFQFDKTSFWFNLRDFLMSCAHDFLFQYRLFKDGRKCTKVEADAVFYYLNKTSWLRLPRWSAKIRMLAVDSKAGDLVWDRRDGGDPIPDHAKNLYDKLPWNKEPSVQ